MYAFLLKIGLKILGWLGKKLSTTSWDGELDDLKNIIQNWISAGTNHLKILLANPKPKKKKSKSKDM